VKVNITTCSVGGDVARVWCNSNTNTHTWCNKSQQDPDWVLTYKDGQLSIVFKQIEHAQAFEEYVATSFVDDINSRIYSIKTSPKGGSFVEAIV